MHTKEMIMEVLKDLHKEFPDVDPYGFTMQQISEKIGRKTPTIQKWCCVLAKEGKIIRTWHKLMSHYFGVRLMEVN